ncbi:hypothetical protein GCM10020295_17150 [Streptomyces cinereospinus]
MGARHAVGDPGGAPQGGGVGDAVLREASLRGGVPARMRRRVRPAGAGKAAGASFPAPGCEGEGRGGAARAAGREDRAVLVGDGGGGAGGAGAAGAAPAETSPARARAPAARAPLRHLVTGGAPVEGASGAWTPLRIRR